MSGLVSAQSHTHSISLSLSLACSLSLYLLCLLSSFLPASISNPLMSLFSELVALAHEGQLRDAIPLGELMSIDDPHSSLAYFKSNRAAT